MPRPSHVIAFLALGSIAYAEEYKPAPPEQVPSYFATVMPCKIERDFRTKVTCDGGLLEKKSLRELSILRNTIYARWGWDGYRKPWLREYFHQQPWFKPNPKFSYKLLSEVDKKNAHFVGVMEQSLTAEELNARKDELFARHGKVWNDKPEFHTTDGKTVKACRAPKNVTDDDKDLDPLEVGSRDCKFAREKWYKPNPRFSDGELSADERVELGLLSRALGEFALDEDSREKSAASLDRVLSVKELRQLSLRDLRLLRNTIYARRGRPFKSQILRDHFEGLGWYKVDPSYSDKLLTANDQRNIALIKSVENEFGGPLADEDWLTEPASDGA